MPVGLENIQKEKKNTHRHTVATGEGGEYFIPPELAHLPVGTCCYSNGSWEFSVRLAGQ